MAIEYLRPISNITQSGFTNGWAEIDESSANDSDYAYGANNTAATLEVKLGALSGTYVTAIVRYRIASLDDGTPRIGASDVDITCYIYEGATLRATDSTQTANGTWTTYDSWQPDLSAINDWTDVRLRFVTEAVSGWGGAISFAEIEVTGTPEPPEEGSGEADATFDAAGIGVANYEGSGEADLILSAVGTGSSPNSGSGLAAIALDAEGVGSSPNAGSGLASVGLDATGVGSSPDSGSGLASTTLGLVGTGSSPDSGIGIAAIALGLIGIGSSPDSGSGEASMMLDAEGIGYNKIAGFGIASLVLDAIGTGSSPNSGSGLAALVLDGVGVGILPGTGYAILAPLFVDLIGTGRGPGYGSGVASFSTSVSGYGDPARSGFGTAGLLTNIQTEILANGKGFLQPQEDVDCCCSGTGEADRCYCGVAFNTCSITWDCPFPRDSWNLPTIEPHMIRITRADDIDGEQTVIIESSSSTGTYPIPTNSNYYYRFQVCCLEPAEGQECDWVTVASGQINSIAVPCTLFPGGLAVYDINDSLGPTCTGQMRIYGAAARTPGSPLITELTIDGTVVATGSTWSALGCMPATVPATINACGTQPVCNPPSGPSELYIDRGYLTSSPDYKVVVKATNAAGQTRSCEMQMPCNFYYNYIRVEVPSWNGVDYDCTGSETLPSGFWSQINNADKVYTSLWRNRFNITLDDPVGGSYFVPQWYDCPSHNPIATGTMDWFWETEGTAKFFDSRVGQNKWVWFPFYYYARWTANIQVLLSLTQDLFGQHHAAVSLNTGTITEQLDYQIPNTLGLPGYYPTAGAVTSITRTRAAYAFENIANTDPYDNTDTVLDCADSPPGLIRSMKWLIKNPWKYANLADFFLDNDGPIFFEPPGVWTTGFTWSGPYPLYLDCLTRPFGADIVEVLQAELVHVP